MSGAGFFTERTHRRGGAGLALQTAEVTEQCGDLTARIFINRVKADQGIEDEKSRAVKHERGLEPLLIGDAVEAQRIGSDDADIEKGQLEPVVLSQRFQA